MPDQDVPLHRVRGLVSGANWRATKFATAVPPHLTCGLCRVISQTTFLLPCFHTLCESCVGETVSEGNAVCPLDEQSFSVGDCPKFPLPPDTAAKLEACCWNEPQGCTFVGTLQDVLTHYEQHCTFHVVSCPRCNGPVLQQDLPRHYRAGCHGDAIANATEQTTLPQGLLLSSDDIATSLDELKALIRDPYQDRLPELQSKLNELLQEARNIGTQVEAVTRAFTPSGQRNAQALGEPSRTFGRNFQSVEAVLCHNQNDTIPMTLSDSVRRITDELTQSRRELSMSFGQELRSQLRELSAHLMQIFDLGTSDACEAGTASASEMSWKLEKRRILRKLELVALDSHAILAQLRVEVDQQQEELLAGYESFFPGNRTNLLVDMSAAMSGLGSQEACYVVHLRNIDELINSNKVTDLFTRWYRPDRYLQVATYRWGVAPVLSLSFCVKWGGTLQDSCSGSRETEVRVRHPDYPEAEDLPMKKANCVIRSAELLGFQDEFFEEMLRLKRLGFVQRGWLTLVIFLK